VPSVTTNTTLENAPAGQSAQELRRALADDVSARHQRAGRPLPATVEAALRTVPRHLFTPGVPLTRAYENDSIVTKTNDRGVNVSAVSAPTIIAGMLAQLDVRPGQSVMEIGSGGYNAALLRELVGPGGSVTTLDIDEDVIGRARAGLDAAGYTDVRTVCADGEFGAAEYAPFDRIIVTVGTWDVPPAWFKQLAADGGRIVLPLRTRGLTRSWALEPKDGHLAGSDHVTCGFVPIQGVGEHRGHWVLLHGEGVGLWVDEDMAVDGDLLAGVLAQPRAEAWSGVRMGKDEAFGDQDLWLMTLPDFCQLTAKQEAIEHGVVTPSWRYGTPALISDRSIAYRAKPRPLDDERSTFECGAYGHGPKGAELADRLAAQIRTWDRDYRTGPGPVLAVHPADAPDDGLPGGFVIKKRHAKVVLSWDRPAQ
jgi:protein-L-isoaspartate(D-aspartate) O-methyltransferase